MMLYRKRHDDDELENDEGQEGQENQRRQEGGDPNLDREEGSWKKRHGDLRRHSQKEKESLQSQIDELKGQLKEAQKSNVKLPKTEEELEAWKTKYPDLGKIIDTMILKRVGDERGTIDSRFDRVKELEERIENDRLEREKKDAYGKLLKAHPDFDDFKDSDEFQTWIENSSRWVQNALWENETDAQSAIDAVDLYKNRTKRSQTNKDNPAARSVARPKNTSPDANGEITYSESMIDRMTAAEYERVEKIVAEQQRNGTFIYDITMAR